MSEIPYARELGRRFESAIQSAKARRPMRGPVVAVVSFAAVLSVAVGTAAVFGLVRIGDAAPQGTQATVVDPGRAHAQIIAAEQERIEAAEQARQQAYEAHEENQKEYEQRLLAAQQALVDAAEQHQQEYEQALTAAEEAQRAQAAALEQARIAALKARSAEVLALEQARIAAEEAQRAEALVALERARVAAEEARRAEAVALAEVRAARVAVARYATIAAAAQGVLSSGALAPLGLSEVSAETYVLSDVESLENEVSISEVKFNGSHDGVPVAVTVMVMEGGEWSLTDELESAGAGTGSTVDIGSTTGALVRSGELTSVSWEGSGGLVIQIVARGPIPTDSLLAYAAEVDGVFETVSG
ncbi:MAG: hypothetical protein ABFR53_09015 [Actinomycetota bacterium]